jgi:protein arginine kinase activator
MGDSAFDEPPGVPFGVLWCSMSRVCAECGGRGIFWVEQNDRSRSLLCESCTQRSLAALDPLAARFLADWLPVRSEGGLKIEGLPDETLCPVCGTTFAEFESSGQAGCGGCYRTFEVAIMPALRILHGSESASTMGDSGGS